MPPTISRKGYIVSKKEITEQQRNRIHKELFVTPHDKNPFNEPIPFRVYRQDAENYYLPRFWALDRIDPNPIIDLPFNPRSIADFKFDKRSLRKQQLPIIGKMISYYSTNCKLVPFQGKFINVGTGVGKTVMALLLMCYIGRKTLIVMHTEPLELQWEDRIHAYVSNANVGYIRGKKYKVEGCNIVLAKVQSLMKSDLPLEELLKDFDTVIYDESHHYASKVFSNVLGRLAFPYNISLTATLERKDKLERVLHWYLGDIGYRITGQLDYDFDIEVLKFKCDDKKLFRTINIFNKGPNISAMITNMTEIESRNKMIVDRARKMLHDEPERHIMMISHRLDHLYLLRDEFEKYFPGQVALIVGKKGAKELDDQVKSVDGKKIVLGIYNLAKEGLDIPHICSIWLLTPMSDALQCCGRMLRKQKHEYIHIPKIIDIEDDLGIFNGMHRSRLKQYKESYLQSENSKLTLWECNQYTNYVPRLLHNVDLKHFFKKVEPKKPENLMDSDSE